MIRIYIADTDTLDLERALEQASETRREKALKISNEDARRLSLGASALMRRVLGRDDHCVSENGKPYLPDGSVHFSLSHCGSKVVCAVSDAPVGVDIELRREGGCRLAGRFFAADEARAVCAAGDPDAEFCRIWTLKESYIKLFDLRLADMRSFSVFDPGAALRSMRYGEYFIGCCANEESDAEITEVKI